MTTRRLGRRGARLQNQFARRARVVLVVVLAVAGSAAVALAQGFGRGRDPEVPYCFAPEECPRTPYDGRFTFVRLFFETRGGMGGFSRRGGGGEPPWHHDRPEAERHLSAIMREISAVRTFDGLTGGNVFALDDPEIYRYPVVWVSEPGFWSPDDMQIRALRAYLLKGGFMIFDDFDGNDMYNLVAQLQRALPELRPIRLTGAEPIWHSFFDIDPNALFVSDNRRQPPDYWGLFEDNDPMKRQLVIMNNNNDIGEFIEHSPTGFDVVGTNEAYKLAVNYMVYALTH